MEKRANGNEKPSEKCFFSSLFPGPSPPLPGLFVLFLLEDIIPVNPRSTKIWRRLEICSLCSASQQNRVIKPTRASVGGGGGGGGEEPTRNNQY